MKRIVCFVLAVCACSHVAVASPEDRLSGRWRGVLEKGGLTSVVELEFARAGGGYRGKYWRPAPTGEPVPLPDIQIGPEIHFQLDTIGTFEGTVHGEILEGTFSDEQGSGSFRLQKQPQWDDLSVGS